MGNRRKKRHPQKDYDTNVKKTVHEEPTEVLNFSTDSPSSTLTYEACKQRLDFVEFEKKKLEEYVNHLASESRVRLEASLEELKQGLEVKIKELSSNLGDLYGRDIVSLSTRSKSNFGRKIFTPVESLLSKMLHYEDENYKTIFNIMICILLLWGISLAIEDYDRSGLPNFDLLIWGIFRDIEPFLKCWLLMFTSSFSILLLAHFGAESSRLGTYIVVFVYCLLQGSFCYFSAWVVNSREMPFAMPLAVGFMAEQARISMKMHSYFREKLLWRRYDGKFACATCSSGEIPVLGFAVPESNYLFGEVEKFYHFLFVPTLVYRDSYPRTIRIRWSFVLLRLLEAVSIVYYAFLIFRQVLPQFRVDVGEAISTQVFVRATFSCM